MSEYWKSAPNYWCKHCKIYVRDTKLEKTNHEATAKHQGAVRRALNSLHRGHERDEREQDRAKREIDRLNGIVSGTGSGKYDARQSGVPAAFASGSQEQGAKEQRQRQLEQLADLGVNIPDNLRRDMALAGEWSVTATRVVKEPGDEDEKQAETSKAIGVRKRELEKTEEQKEEEKAMEGLFKKPKRWGRDSSTMPTEDDELDALLGRDLTRPVKNPTAGAAEDADKITEEPNEDAGKTKADGAVTEEGQDTKTGVKQEAGPGTAEAVVDAAEASAATGTPEAPVVFFKKRKAKNIRQK